MNIENAINIMNAIEWAILNSSIHNLDYSLDEMYQANELCIQHRARAFTRERICELFIIMHSPIKNITSELLNTTTLFNN
jgi:hypothetical protein